MDCWGDLRFESEEIRIISDVVTNPPKFESRAQAISLRYVKTSWENSASLDSSSTVLTVREITAVTGWKIWTLSPYKSLLISTSFVIVQFCKRIQFL